MIARACPRLAWRWGATPRRRRRRWQRGKRRSPIRSRIPCATPSRRRLGATRNRTSALPLEWPDGVVDLLSPRRLLKVGLTSTAAIGDASLGDPVISDGVVVRDVERVYDPRHGQLAHLVIDAHFLRSRYDEIAIGKDAGDDRRHRHLNLLGPVDVSRTLSRG